MTQQIISTGTGPNTNTGDPLRTAFTKVNSNFTELYGDVSVLREANQGQYAAFYDTTTQTIAADTAQAVSLNTTYLASTISVSSSSQISFLNTGIYDFNYRLQLQNTGASNRAISIWLRLNGANGLNTSVTATVPAGQTIIVPGQYLLQVTAGSYIQVMWSAPATDVRLLYTGPQTVPDRPGNPSAIVTVNRIQVVS